MKSGKGVDGGGCVCCYVEIQQHPTIPPLEGQLEIKYVLRTFIFLHSGEERVRKWGVNFRRTFVDGLALGRKKA